MSLKDWKPKKAPTIEEAEDLIGKTAVCGEGDRRTVGIIKAVHFRDGVQAEFDGKGVPLAQLWPLPPGETLGLGAPPDRQKAVMSL